MWLTRFSRPPPALTDPVTDRVGDAPTVSWSRLRWSSLRQVSVLPCSPREIAPRSSWSPPQPLRIVGLPGESIVLDGPLVVVDGAPVTEPYLGPDTTDTWASAETVTLDRDEYLLLADNRGSSDIAVVPVERISRWAPAETTALQALPMAERPAVLADYVGCLQTAGIDVEGLPTDHTIFDATVARLDPQTVEGGARCMRGHHRLSLE